MTADGNTIAQRAAKRIALFAHYDRDGIIDDYVLYYLRGLRRVAARILFVSDCELRVGEVEKLEGLAELVFADRHGEYDFGSWKRAFAALGDSLGDWDEVIIANDSCYAPIYPFEDVFARMDTVECDFWSPSVAFVRDKADHLASYFMVFRARTIQNASFKSFWKSIKQQPNNEEVVNKYEKGLSYLLINQGMKWSALVANQKEKFVLKTDKLLGGSYLVSDLFIFRSSWLKVRLLRDNPWFAPQLGKHLKAISKLYPRNLIDSHLRRIIGCDDPRHYHDHIIGNYVLDLFYDVKIISKIRINRRRRNPIAWWKLKISINRFYIPMFIIPLPKMYVNRKPLFIPNDNIMI